MTSEFILRIVKSIAQKYAREKAGDEDSKTSSMDAISLFLNSKEDENLKI